jgi:tetratricopeptide (TPR) repeat protein
MAKTRASREDHVAACDLPGQLTSIDTHRNVRPMLRAAIDPKLWVLAALASAFAHDVSFAQAPAAPPVATPQVQTPAPKPPVAQPPAQTAPSAPGAASTSGATAAPAAEPTPAAKESARVAYTRGQAAFSAGQYDVALRAFEEAFAAVPNPIVLLSVAESHAKLGHVREAAAALHRYLALRPDAPDRGDVEAKLKGLENTPAFVSVTSVPSGAELTIDESPVLQRAPAQIELTPGKHTLKYALPGYTSSAELLTVDPGARYDLEIVLKPAAPPEAPPPAPVAATTPPPAAEPISPAALWITGGIGAAGIVTGTVLGFLALKAKSDFDSDPTESHADKGERLALFADVGFGVGIMALATTAVLIFTHDAPSATPAADTPAATSSRKPAPRASLEVTPQFSPTTASATARLRF